MSDSKPLVSIGMPVYNGEKYLREALDSLLAQDYDNFELIISDNASNDGTAEICREYVSKEKRIRYYRNETNLGAVVNFNRVLEFSSGKYFMWAADDNLCHPSFISRCVSILENEPDVVLTYSQTMLIDSNGESLRLMPDRIDTRGMNAVERFQYIICNLSWCNMMYGVIRREALNQTGKFRNVWGSDIALLSELSLKGSFAQIPSVLFYRRKNKQFLEPDMYKESALVTLDPSTAAEKRTKSIACLTRDLGRAHLLSVANASIPLLDKLRLWFWVQQHYFR